MQIILIYIYILCIPIIYRNCFELIRYSLKGLHKDISIETCHIIKDIIAYHEYPSTKDRKEALQNILNLLITHTNHMMLYTIDSNLLIIEETTLSSMSTVKMIDVDTDIGRYID